MSESADHLVRTQNFPATGPVELDLSLSAGRIAVRLLDDDEYTGEVTVELRHEPDGQAPWAEGVTAVLGWFTDRLGDQFDTDLLGSPAEAVRQARIEQVGEQIVIRGPKAPPLRKLPLAVLVHAPRGSHLGIRAGEADVTVTGTAGRAEVSSGGGDITLGETKAGVNVRTGAGDIELGPSRSVVQLRTGSGDVRLAAPGGSTTAVTGTGAVWIGTITGDVVARTGSGDLTVTEARSGSIELNSGSGEIRLGLAEGVAAEIDLSSGTGTVSSSLDVQASPPSGEVAVRVRARTGTGNAVVAGSGG